MSNPSSTALTADDQKQLQTLFSGFPSADAVALPNCDTYNKYRSILQLALPLVAKIPVFGSKIHDALQFLMTLADAVCPAPPADTASGGDSAATARGKITVDKLSANALKVTFPQGTVIGSDAISEADLYFALSQNLINSATLPGTAACAFDVCFKDS
jgi:hypothetical protein